jgi:Flp pilus assembly protein TadD
MLPLRFRSLASAAALAVVLCFCLVGTVRRNADWRDQFTFYSKAFEESPNSPDMENGLAELFRSERGDLISAERHFLQAAALAHQQSPPEWDQIDYAEVGLALIYSERGQIGDALEALDTAEAADPTDARVKGVRGAVLLQAGRWKEAETILRKHLEEDPNDENAWNAVGFIAWQDEHRDDQALSYFQAALRLHPTSDSFNSSLHNSLGALYCEMGRWSEGIAHLQRAIELMPNDPEAYTNLGNAFSATGRFADARAEFEKALALAPDYAPARASIANLPEQERHSR